jgi:hypothetical protein
MPATAQLELVAAARVRRRQPIAIEIGLTWSEVRGQVGFGIAHELNMEAEVDGA